jgi:hypothetical protein
LLFSCAERSTSEPGSDVEWKAEIKETILEKDAKTGAVKQMRGFKKQVEKRDTSGDICLDMQTR